MCNLKTGFNLRFHNFNFLNPCVSSIITVNYNLTLIRKQAISAITCREHRTCEYNHWETLYNVTLITVKQNNKPIKTSRRSTVPNWYIQM